MNRRQERKGILRKSFIIMANVVIMAAVVTFVVLYSIRESRNAFLRQADHFENQAVTLESVAEKYLEGEQRICDVWAKTFVGTPLSMQEAAAFFRKSEFLPHTSAHFVYLDTLQGLSTHPREGTEDDYAVSYADLDVLGNGEWIQGLGQSVNVTRIYTNPMTGEPSLAFCNKILLQDAQRGEPRPVILLRVMAVSEIERTWVFPQMSFADAQLALIDGAGSYVMRGDSFGDADFFSYYGSVLSAQEKEAPSPEELTAQTGWASLRDARGQRCVLAFTPVRKSSGWTLLGLVPAGDLAVDAQNWLLIGVISGGLLLLFLLDLFFILYFNKRLQQALKEAEAANKAKTDFLSAMSHDIRTPMNAIIGLKTIAEKTLDDPEAMGESLRKIGLASSHLLTLVNDILDISKVESGKLTLSPLTFSIVETVESLVTLSHPMIKEKGLDFAFHINRMEQEYLYADQLRLNQIFINLLSNAIKYTEPGGRVSVELREEPSAKSKCVRLTYVVADTGIGMSPAFMETMYQPFSRQTDSRVNSIQGTGLGLAITKQMVELMGGTIDCQSELGQGTTFTVVLDIPVSDRQREDMKLDPMDVLVVDDDEILLQTAVDTLTSLGVTAEQARGGLEALGMITRRHQAGRDYSVVILDWKMPELDGIETIKRIRAEIETRIPILLVSAYDWSDIEEAAKEAGANGFVSKPLFRSTLYDKINELTGAESKSIEPEDDYSDLAGLHILIAEDNLINWEIISAMLGMYGITTERAENGRICVDRMREAAERSEESKPYALIFMDIQMPEMNGLDATRAIRELPDPWASSIPIVAMTADAFSENVTECLNAGMNGHIAKPVDMKLVIKEIRRIKEERRE